MHIDAAMVARLLDRPSPAEALATAFRDGCEAPRRHRHAVAAPGGADATLPPMPAWIPGRRRADEVTLLKSVGVSFEDPAAAVLCDERAHAPDA